MVVLPFRVSPVFLHRAFSLECRRSDIGEGCGSYPGNLKSNTRLRCIYSTSGSGSFISVFMATASAYLAIPIVWV